jgi:hypothetical protein
MKERFQGSETFVFSRSCEKNPLKGSRDLYRESFNREEELLGSLFVNLLRKKKFPFLREQNKIFQAISKFSPDLRRWGSGLSRWPREPVLLMIDLLAMSHLEESP